MSEEELRTLILQQKKEMYSFKIIRQIITPKKLKLLTDIIPNDTYREMWVLVKTGTSRRRVASLYGKSHVLVAKVVNNIDDKIKLIKRQSL